MIDYRLYLVTDDPSRYAPGVAWLDNIVAAVEGGATCIQYRDTESVNQTKFERIRRLQDALAGRVPLIVNNDAELARAVKAEGVHVGQNDMPVAAVRALVGPNCEIGLSITSSADVEKFCRQNEGMVVQCVGIGPIFDARATKADASAAMGVEGLQQLVQEFPDCPSVAIGGINLKNAREVLSTGVGGLAVVSAFSKAENPYETARDFTLLLDDCRI